MARLTSTVLGRWEKAFDALDQHLGPEKAARLSGLSPSTLYRFVRGDQTSRGLEAAQTLGRQTVGGDVVAKPLAPEVLEALDDFEKFRFRFMGRRSMPWQVRAANDMLTALQTPDREYMVVNCPPGAGKSTLFTHDILCWLIARDRTIRIMIGSRTEKQARMYVRRIKNTLEREVPMRAHPEEFEAGTAFDATDTMLNAFTAFQPEGRSELWRADQLVLRQLDGVSLDDKEPSVSAWGQDSGFLGGRFDLVIWDDLVDRKNTKTTESQEDIRLWWSTEAEPRIEPGGVFVLQGQRISHHDLYRYCLDMRNLSGSPKYRHIMYQSHDDEHCRGHDNDTTLTPLPWPDGCLLDPVRLPMPFLEQIKVGTPRVYQVQYQQLDGDNVGGLLQEAWIKGGVDDDGYNAPGCLDLLRGIREPPEHLLDGKAWSLVTVDPSPTEWWGVIWWLLAPDGQNRYVLDIIRRRMNPEQFLSYDLDTREFGGVLEDLRLDSNRLRVPLQQVVVEINGAQRFLLQQPYVQRWMEATGIVISGHTTHVNKADPKFGLESIGDLFRQGLIRLPHKDVASRMKVSELVNEGLQYPDTETTDLLMSTWFHKLAFENLWRPDPRGRVAWRPQGLLSGTERGLTGWSDSRGLAGVSR